MSLETSVCKEDRSRVNDNVNFFAGDAINRFYLLIFVPLGVVGNILSFLVISLFYIMNFSEVAQTYVTYF